MSFCHAAEQGRFPELRDRDALWHLLVVLTARKVINLLKHEGRQKRGGGLGRPLSLDDPALVEQVCSSEPTPELALQVADECRRLLDRLGDDRLRTLALWKLDGLTNEEIARRLGCVPRTVDRKLALIRQIWETEIEP